MLNWQLRRKDCKEDKCKPAKRMKLAPLTNWGCKLREKRQGVLDCLTVPEETKLEDDENDRNWLKTEGNIPNSASADGGPRSRVCARETLCSAPH